MGVSQTCLAFGDLHTFEDWYSHIFVKCPSNGIWWFDAFLITGLRLWVWGEDRKAEHHFNHIFQAYILSVQLIPADTDLAHLAKEVFVSFIRSKVTLCLLVFLFMHLLEEVAVLSSLFRREELRSPTVSTLDYVCVSLSSGMMHWFTGLYIWSTNIIVLSWLMLS